MSMPAIPSLVLEPKSDAHNGFCWKCLPRLLVDSALFRAFGVWRAPLRCTLDVGLCDFHGVPGEGLSNV
eukprot:5737279-Amphidinium_carterae.1